MSRDFRLRWEDNREMSCFCHVILSCHRQLGNVVLNNVGLTVLEPHRKVHTRTTCNLASTSCGIDNFHMLSDRRPVGERLVKKTIRPITCREESTLDNQDHMIPESSSDSSGMDLTSYMRRRLIGQVARHVSIQTALLDASFSPHDRDNRQQGVLKFDSMP